MAGRRPGSFCINVDDRNGSDFAVTVQCLRVSATTAANGPLSIENSRQVHGNRAAVGIIDLQDVWGEVSAGVNFFNPSANTSVFTKVDVTFGEDIDGIGGKAGMRAAW